MMKAYRFSSWCVGTTIGPPEMSSGSAIHAGSRGGVLVARDGTISPGDDFVAHAELAGPAAREVKLSSIRRATLLPEARVPGGSKLLFAHHRAGLRRGDGCSPGRGRPTHP